MLLPPVGMMAVDKELACCGRGGRCATAAAHACLQVSLFEGRVGDAATWKTCVRAKGHVKALLLTRAHVATLLKQQPQAQAALRAGEAAPRCSILVYALPAYPVLLRRTDDVRQPVDTSLDKD